MRIAASRTPWSESMRRTKAQQEPRKPEVQAQQLSAHKQVAAGSWRLWLDPEQTVGSQARRHPEWKQEARQEAQRERRRDAEKRLVDPADKILPALHADKRPPLEAAA